MGRGGMEYTGFIWLRTRKNKNGNELWVEENFSDLWGYRVPCC